MGIVFWTLAIMAAVTSLLSSRALIAWLQGTLAVSETPLPDGEQDDVVIVLGYALFKNGSITQPLKGRVLYGVRAWEQVPNCSLIFSGAHPGDGIRSRSEASAMLSYALQVRHSKGTVPETWILEQESTSTHTNAVYSLAILQQKGWTRALVVTNTFHQLRSLWVFIKVAKDLGMQLKVRMAFMPFVGHEGWGGGPLLNTAMDHVDFWRELAAIAWYKYRGYI